MGIAVLDRFKRANSTTTLGTADSGQAWSSGNGTWGIDTQRAYTPSGVTSGVDGALAFVDVGDAVQSVFMDIIGGAPTGIQDMGPLLRYVDANNWWTAFFNRSSGGSISVYAGKFIAGVGTYVIANNVAATPAALGSAPTQSVECIGLTVDASNVWRAYFNGVQVGTATDSALSTATKVGFKNYNTTTGQEFDAFWVKTASGVYVPPETVQSFDPYERLVKTLSPDAYWPLNDSTAPTRDVSGNGMDLYQPSGGTLLSGQTDVLPGGVGSSFSNFTQTTSRLVRGARPELDAGTGDFTVMWWGNYDPTLSGGKQWNMPVFLLDSMPSGGAAGDGIRVLLRTDANDALVHIGGVSATFTGLGSGVDNRSHCFILERASGVVTAYIDGVAAGTSSTQTGAIMPAGRFVGIGSDGVPGGSVNYWIQGRQNHTAFWKRALTAAERSLLLRAGFSQGVVV